MSSPGQSSGTNKAAELFENLWRQLGECHHNTLQGNGHYDEQWILWSRAKFWYQNKISFVVLNVRFNIAFVAVFRTRCKSEQVEKGTLSVSILCWSIFDFWPQKMIWMLQYIVMSELARSASGDDSHYRKRKLLNLFKFSTEHDNVFSCSITVRPKHCLKIVYDKGKLPILINSELERAFLNEWMLCFLQRRSEAWGVLQS